MGMIRMFLIDAQHPEAVSLLRAARLAFTQINIDLEGDEVVYI